MTVTADELLYLFHLLSSIDGVQKGQGEPTRFLFDKGMSISDAEKFINTSIALFRADIKDDTNTVDTGEIKWYIEQVLNFLREREIPEAEATLEIILEDFF